MHRDLLYGPGGDRTLDLRVANAALSQLSYEPTSQYIITHLFKKIKKIFLIFEKFLKNYCNCTIKYDIIKDNYGLRYICRQTTSAESGSCNGRTDYLRQKRRYRSS